MNLIEALKPIIGSTTAKVTLEVSANQKVAGEMVVVVRPVVGVVANNASEELKHLCAALATPIKVIGTPEVIEQEIAAVVGEQAGHRNSWDAQAAELNALIAKGAKADANKLKGKPDGKQETAAVSPGAASSAKTPKPDESEATPQASSKPFSL